MRELRCIPDADQAFQFFKQEKVQRIQGQKAEEGFLSLHSFTLRRCCFTP